MAAATASSTVIRGNAPLVALAGPDVPNPLCAKQERLNASTNGAVTRQVFTYQLRIGKGQECNPGMATPAPECRSGIEGLDSQDERGGRRRERQIHARYPILVSNGHRFD
jgi:hypothetical protein